MLVLFVVMEAMDFTLYFNAPAATQRQVLGFALVRLLWSIVCMGAMWQRQNWGRYLLVVRLLWAVLASGIGEMSLADRGADSHRLMIAIGSTLGHLIVAVVLIASPSISRLCNPSPHSDFR